MTARAPAIALAAVACLTGAPLQAHAQRADTAYLSTGRILGLVVDEGTKEPIEGVAVRVVDYAGFAAVTDSRGRFTFLRVPRGVQLLEIEHIGYGSGSHLVNVPGGETVEFSGALARGAIALDSLLITADVSATQLGKVGFHERARRGFGHFFSGGDVSSIRIREVLYSIPRVQFLQSSGASSRQLVMPTTKGGVCSPPIFLNGVHQTWANGDLEGVVVGLDIEALEVYRGLQTPGQFMINPQFAPCGAIVVWTRR